MVKFLSVSGKVKYCAERSKFYLFIAAILIGLVLFPERGTADDTISADGYYTTLNTLYQYFAPGVIRPDEGTIEITVRIDKPLDQFGSNWEFIFNLVPSQQLANGGNTMLGAYIPPMPSDDLYFLLRNNTGSCYNSRDFSYTPGTAFNLAFNWKANDSTKIYKNGVLLGSTAMTAALDGNLLPYIFKVDKSDPYHVSRIKISTVQLAQAQLSANPANNFTADAGTTCLLSNDMTSTTKYTTTWHTSSNYAALIPAFRADTQCFRVGDSIYCPFLSVNNGATDKTYDVAITATDAYGAVKCTRTASIVVAHDSTYRINRITLTGLTAAGFYNISTTISSGGAQIAAYNSGIAIVPANTAVTDGTLKSYYGTHPTFEFDFSVWEKLNVSIGRTWEDNRMFLWWVVQPTQTGGFTWDKTDNYVDRCYAAGIDTIGVLGYPSRWAAQVSTVQDPDIAYSLYPERWMVSSLTDWGNYVYQTVNRYKAKVKYWEIWNEVNFHPPYLQAAFSGSTTDYLLLQQTAYTNAKLADPNCKILSSGFAAVPKPACDSDMAMDITDSSYSTGYYDIYNVHGYQGCAAGSLVDSWINNLKTEQPGKKYWMTECMSFASPDETLRVFDTVYSYVSFLAAGFEKYINMGVPASNVFINRYSLSPTPVFQAVGVLQNNIRKCNSMDTPYSGFACASEFSLKHCFSRTDGKKLSILGGQSGYNITFTGGAGTIDSVTDAYGNPVTVVVNGSTSKISIANIAYVISSARLQIADAVNRDGQYAKNGGFEQILGDLAGGLASCTPNNWNEIDNDPSEQVTMSSSPASGSYAVSALSSGGGSVYVSQDFTPPSTGRYILTAKLKKVGTGTFQPYLFFKNKDTAKVTSLVLSSANVDSTKYTTFSTTTDIETIPATGETFGVGITSGAGEVLIDDVTVTRTDLTVSIIVDNTAAAYAGTWGTSSTSTEKYGTDYRHDNNDKSATKTATFSPNITTAGDYDVYMWWPSAGGYAASVPVTVNSANRTLSTIINQQASGGNWNFIGNFRFNSGTSGNVVINNAGTTSFVIADAVKFVKTSKLEIPGVDVIKDNADGTGMTFTGTWNTGTDTGKYGADCRNDGNAGKGTKSVTFAPTVAADGNYNVYMWWPASASFANNAPVTINTATRAFSATVNQQLDGGTWNYIGNFYFAAGSAGTVVVGNAGTTQQVVADAVKFVKTSITDLPVQVIGDNADASGVIVTGAWSSSSGNSPRNGADYLHDANTEKGSRSVKFTPSVPGSGNYDMYIIWPAAANYANNVPVTINTPSRTFTTTLNQTATISGGWNFIGNFALNPDMSGSVIIGNAGTSGYVIADAVKLSRTAVTELTDQVIVDNADGSGVTLTGSWTASTGNSPKNGTNYLHDGNTGKGTKAVTFTPNIPAASYYNVYVCWCAGGSYAPSVPVTVTANGKSLTTNINQTVTVSGGWNYIGNFYFAAGSNPTTGNVVISNAGTSGFVIADAVKFVKTTTTVYP